MFKWTNIYHVYIMFRAVLSPNGKSLQILRLIFFVLCFFFLGSDHVVGNVFSGCHVIDL